MLRSKTTLLRREPQASVAPKGGASTNKRLSKLLDHDREPQRRAFPPSSEKQKAGPVPKQRASLRARRCQERAKKLFLYQEGLARRPQGLLFKKTNDGKESDVNCFVLFFIHRSPPWGGSLA
jgi:hypothetical protein